MTPDPSKGKSQADLLRIPALEVIQGNTRCIVTKMTLPQLKRFAMTDFYSSDYSDTDEQQGYQRPLSEGRARQIHQFMIDEQTLRNAVRMPGTVLCSARDAKIEIHDGMLHLYPYHKLYIVDGQHRAAAYQLILDNKSLENAEDFEVPVTIVTEIAKNEEMRLFNTINSTQKSVDGSLTAQILAMVESNGGKLSVKEETSAVLATIVRRLNDDEESPFYRKIVMPDSYRAGVGRITKAKTLQDSLKPIDGQLFSRKLDSSVSIETRAEKVYRLVLAVWSALREIDTLKDAFIDPTQYALQQAGGVATVHWITANLMRDYFTARTYGDKQLWADLFRRSPSLSSSAFWHRGNPELQIPRGRGSEIAGNTGIVLVGNLIFSEIRPDAYFSGEDTPPYEALLPSSVDTLPDNVDSVSADTVDDELDVPFTIDVMTFDDLPSEDAEFRLSRTPIPEDIEVPEPEPEPEAAIDIHPSVFEENTGGVLVIDTKPKTKAPPKRKRSR